MSGLASRYQSSEYEDLGNERELEKIFQVDGGVRYAISGQHAISLHIENLFDEEFETGISTAGLVSISAPRTVWLSWTFPDSRLAFQMLRPK